MNDGGPAFPQAVPPGVIGAGCGPHVEWGMTLRDYFAAKAMQGLCAYHGTNGGSAAGPVQSSPQVVANRAYEIADAMIAARGKDGDK